MVEFDRYVEGLERRRDRRGPENLVVLPVVASTNALARSIITEYQNEGQTLHPFLVLALEQSGGRGRQGRTWSSPSGKGVYATRVLPVADPTLLQTYRKRYRDGIPRRSIDDEEDDARTLFRVLSLLGGRDLVGPEKELAPGTFYRPDSRS